MAPKKRPAEAGAQREGRRVRLQRLEAEAEASFLIATIVFGNITVHECLSMASVINEIVSHM